MNIKHCALTLISALFMSNVCLAEIKTRSIEYKDKDTVLQGFVAYDDALKGAKPGVLLTHEWWGHNDYIEKRAKEYAALGYVAFALDMYGKGKLADTATDASALSKPFYDDRNLMRSRAATGLEQLKKFNAGSISVDPNKLSALGYCFGGTVTLELARSGAPLKSVISFHGGLSTPHLEDAKNIKARVLVLNGADDPMVTPEERSAFMQEMKAANVDWQFVEFGGAVHAFTNPGADARNIPGVKYNAAADTRSFAMSKLFLEETLR